MTKKVKALIITLCSIVGVVVTAVIFCFTLFTIKDVQVDFRTEITKGYTESQVIKESGIEMGKCVFFLKKSKLEEQIESLNLSTKTLVYSAFDSDDIIRCASQKGASLYLVKPLSPQIVLERLNGLFQKENSQLGKTAVNASSANDKHTHLSPQETVQSATDNATELRISNVFLSAGIPPHIKGYAFMRMGVKLVIKNSNLLSNITKELYPQIATAFNTSPSKVERAIRHAIEVAWNRGRIENLNSIFGVTFYQSGDKPTNGEFIALVADRIIQEIHMGKLG